jgi:hypothetical protein
VIFISFSNWTQFNKKEEADSPLVALCRRIAFVTLKDPQPQQNFNLFLKYNVTSQSVLDWLGENKCLLLIDELSYITCLANAENEKAKVITFAYFLKQYFLRLKGRYFVFSSHVITTCSQLSDFMESNNSRNVIVKELPIISSVNVVKSVFKLASLPPHQALLYGLAPAIIFTAMKIHYPISKREQAIEACIPLVSKETVLTLLHSFLTGERNVMAPLLLLMDKFYDTIKIFLHTLDSISYCRSFECVFIASFYFKQLFGATPQANRAVILRLSEF